MLNKLQAVEMASGFIAIGGDPNDAYRALCDAGVPPKEADEAVLEVCKECSKEFNSNYFSS
jgi:hypothetical protein